MILSIKFLLRSEIDTHEHHITYCDTCFNSGPQICLQNIIYSKKISEEISLFAYFYYAKCP